MNIVCGTPEIIEMGPGKIDGTIIAKVRVPIIVHDGSSTKFERIESVSVRDRPDQPDMVENHIIRNAKVRVERYFDGFDRGNLFTEDGRPLAA